MCIFMMLKREDGYVLIMIFNFEGGRSKEMET